MGSSTPGYSGTPLAKKLGIQEGTRVLLKNAPEAYPALIEPAPPGIVFVKRLSEATDIVHLFCTEAAKLKTELASLRKGLRSNAVLWVSWPKKASKVATDLNENLIRELALPLGFVDIKVCAVSKIWSGLKLVIRKEHR
jgi:hypothetical protein